SVADDGPGFPPDIDPETLFDKFQRGHAEGAQGGVGLGLAICRAIARAHGGEIHAERIPAGGPLFSLIVPLTEEAPVVPEEPRSGPPPNTPCSSSTTSGNCASSCAPRSVRTASVCSRPRRRGAH